jgi:hypothetical protein
VTPTTVTTYPQKISFGELRASGVRDVLVYCRDHPCSRQRRGGSERGTQPWGYNKKTARRRLSLPSDEFEANADGWPDHIRLSDIEPGFVCTACGKRVAEVRPKFSQAKMGTG